MEEVLEVDLVLEECRRAIGATELHEPAGKIHAHLLVPDSTKKRSIVINTTRRDWIGFDLGRGYSLCGSTHSRCWSGSFFLQESRMSQRFLTPIAAAPLTVAGAGEEGKKPNGKQQLRCGRPGGFRNSP